MELYDEAVENKKSKIPMIIGILIVILTIITILIIVLMFYLKNSIKTFEIDSIRKDEISKYLFIEKNENGSEIYIPILKISKYLGYEGFNGDYKDKSEDKTKCHVENENETAMFEKDSNVLIKITDEMGKEYIHLEKAVFEKNGELYTTIEGIEKAFNVLFLYDEGFKNIKIYSMDFLINTYATNLQIEEYSNKFSDKKAMLEGMIIIEENGKSGVIDISNKQTILECKYEEISYLPSLSHFLVKSNGKYGIVDIEVNTKLKIGYDEIKIMDSEKGLYLVKQNGTYGIINAEGKVIIEPEYMQIGINVDKYAENGVENGYIILDEIIPIKNEQNLWGLFKLNGEKLIDFKYTDIGCKETPVNNSYPALIIPSHKIIVVKKEKNYNLVTIEGEELIEGDIINSVYFKTNTSNQETQFYMTSGDNTKTLNINEWLTSIGR